MKDAARSERVAVLAGWIDEWSDPRGTARRQLCELLPSATGFHPATVEAGLAVAWDHFRGEDLTACVARELDSTLDTSFNPFERTCLVLAGALPMPTFQALLHLVVLGGPVLVKASRHDSVSAEIFRQDLARVDPSLAGGIEVAANLGHEALAKELERSDCVVAYGSDETVAELRSRVGAPVRFVSHGHRVSFAVVGSAATGEELRRCAQGLALDVCLWDQLGCLSPVAALVHASVASELSEVLAEELAAAQSRWPRGELDPGMAGAFAEARLDAEFRAATGRGMKLLADENNAWVVVRELGSALRPSPLHRFLRIHPFEDLAELRSALRPAARHLAAVGLGGFSLEEMPELLGMLESSGASRVCPLGTMQGPPLGWHHDNQPVFLPFARATNLEL